MPRRAPLLALLCLPLAAAAADAQLVHIGENLYFVDRIGGVEAPGAFNDPGDFTQPTYVTQAPNDDNSLYIIERTEASSINNEAGRIIKFDQTTNTSSTYLDLSGTLVSDGGIALSTSLHIVRKACPRRTLGVP